MSRRGTVECQELSPLQKQMVTDTLRLILQSPHFSKSKRYPALLEYIVVHTLSGEYDALKERTLAAEVFDRPAGYDSSSDSTVRTIAGEVRRRMNAYFSDHPDGPVRIDLPLGSYVAEFTFPASPSHISVEPVPEPPTGEASLPKVIEVAPRGIERRTRIGRNLIYAVCAFAVIAIAALLLWNHAHTSVRQSFWWPVLHNDTPAIIAVGGGIDPGDVAKTPDDSDTNPPPRDNNKITLGNAVAVSEVCNAFRSFSRECRISPAKSAPDLRNNTIVLIGAFDNNLTPRFLSGVRYQFAARPTALDASKTARMIVDQSNPSQNTSWMLRPGLPDQAESTDYAILGRFQSKINDGTVVVIGGLSAAGTESAAEYASSVEHMREILARAPKKWSGLNFEAVLEVNLIGGDPAHTRVIAAEFW